MPKVTLICPTCGKTARRELLNQPGSRGVHETPSEPARCPDGHGKMIRKDGRRTFAGDIGWRTTAWPTRRSTK